MRDDNETASLATLAAAFAIGAGATWLVYTWRERRRMPVEADDETVRRRVLERVSAVASSPQSIDVNVVHGVVRLSGTVPQHERDAILTSVLDVPGVFRVRNALGVGS